MTAESNYDDWHSGNDGEDDTNSVWHKFIKNYISVERDVNTKKILEIACGRGGLTNYLSRLSDDIKSFNACDYSKTAIELAKENYYYPGSPIEWSQEDIMKLSFADNQFDTAISCETIEHVPNPQKAVEELFRVLKPGGRLFLTCPNYFNAFGLWCVYRYLIKKPYTEGQPFVNYPLYPSILLWIKKAGFKIEKRYTSNLVLPLWAHYHCFENEMPKSLTWLGFRTFFILEKPVKENKL